jgi:2-oxoglutarate ferredoxin oxidoreductase subunit gamma
MVFKRAQRDEMKNDRYEIRFAGSGGQGIITAALIFAEAAAMDPKNHVCQTQSYGPEARGGTSKAEVIISKQSIDYPRATGLDLLLALNQPSCDAYFTDLKPDGLLIVDATLVHQIPTKRVAALPFSKIARDTVGKELAMNAVVLGAASYVTGVVSPENMERALRRRVPKGTEAMNLKAFRAGVKAAKKIDMAALPKMIEPQEEED